MKHLLSMVMILSIFMTVVILVSFVQLGTVSAEVLQATVESQLKCSANQFAMWVICLLLGLFYIVVLSYLWTTDKEWKLSEALSEVAIVADYNLINSFQKIKILTGNIPKEITKIEAKFTKQLSQEITNQLIQKYKESNQEDEELSQEVTKQIIEHLNQKDKQLSQEITNKLIQKYKESIQKIANKLIQKYKESSQEITKLSTVIENFNKEEAKPRLIASSSRFLAFTGLIVISGMLLISSYLAPDKNNQY
jgi:hypothetical protein